MSRRPLPSQPLVDRLDTLVPKRGRQGACRACNDDFVIRASIAAALDRGNSMTAISKVLGVHRDTLTKCIEGCT